MFVANPGKTVAITVDDGTIVIVPEGTRLFKPEIAAKLKRSEVFRAACESGRFILDGKFDPPKPRAKKVAKKRVPRYPAKVTAKVKKDEGKRKPQED